MRQFQFGVAHKIKTLFMSDKEKHDFQLFLIYKTFLLKIAPDTFYPVSVLNPEFIQSESNKP